VKQGEAERNRLTPATPKGRMMDFRLQNRGGGLGKGQHVAEWAIVDVLR